MKNKLIFLLFMAVVFHVRVSAQSNTYMMLKDSTAWCYVRANTLDGYYDYYCYMVDGDTIIKNRSYKNIYKYTGEYDRGRATYEGSMREEGEKVYSADQPFDLFFDLDTINGETLLYDFSYGVGDTVGKIKNYKPCVITLIEQLEMVDGIRKIYTIDRRLSGIWIEGIGSRRESPFKPCTQIYAGYTTWNLSEFVQDGKMLYNPPVLNLAKDGVHWLERESTDDAGVYTLINYRVSGDTIINKFPYKKVYANNSYHGAIRMNIEHKVYYYRKDMSKEILLYDFAWAGFKALYSTNYAGEDFLLVTKKEMSHYSDTVLLDLNKYRYRPLLINPNPLGVPFSSLNKDILLIECIGLTSGMFSHVETERKEGVRYNDLICLYNGDQIIYQNPAFTKEGEFTSGVESLAAEKRLQVSVQGNEVVFTLKEDSGRVDATLSVYGADGRLLSVHQADAGTVTVSNMSQGVFYYRLEWTNGSGENGKFTVGN